jgi:two-component sensor histidine kinase
MARISASTGVAEARVPVPGIWAGLRRSATPARMIAAAALLSTLLGVALFTFVAWSEWQDGLGRAEQRTVSLAHLLAEHAGRVLDAANLSLGQIMPLIDGRRWDEVAADTAGYRQLVRLTDSLDYLTALWLTDETGMPRLTSREFPAPPIDTSDREYFTAQSQRDHGPMVSRLTQSRVTATPNIVLARRLQGPDGRFRGIAQAVIEPSYFFAFYASLGLPPGTEIVMFRDDLGVVFRYPALPPDQALALVKWHGRPALGDDVWQNTLRTVSTADGQLRIETFRRVERFPVYVSAGIAMAELRRAWLWTILPQGLLAAVALGSVVALSGIAFRLARREERAQIRLEEEVVERTGELRAALRSRELLMNELNHRIKNNLQLISSFLNLQIKKTDNADAQEYLSEARIRVAAIADLHTHLYQSAQVEQVELGGYVRKLCHDLENGPGRAAERPVRVVADRVEMPTDTAVPLAMILTELVTNAQKHAYPNESPGDIDVRLEATATGVRLVVSDAGAGFAGAAPSGRGLGLTLVQALTRQLGAVLTLPTVARGTRIEIDVPAERRRGVDAAGDAPAES